MTKYRSTMYMVTSEQKAKTVEAFEAVVKVACAGVPVQPLAGWISLGPVRPVGGYWYFGFHCRHCKRMSPLFRDFSEGHLGNPFVGYGVSAACIFCHSEAQRPAATFQSSQWPLETAQAPPPSYYAALRPRVHTEDPEYQPLSGLLHHYTSLEVLLSVTKSKSLWATNVHYLNDSSEIELGLAQMRTVAREAQKQSDGVDADFISFFIEWLKKRVFESASVYVLCFSQAHNQLSQWRGYTAHGRGVCLSFDVALLVRRMQAQGWTFQNCRYQKKSQLGWSEAISSRMRQSAIMRDRESNKEKVFDEIIQSNLSDLLQVAATIKHGGFIEEKEVRFISPMIHLRDQRVEYRVGRSALIPYVEFRLAEAQDEAPKIAEIMIGPSPSQELTLSSIGGLVMQKKIQGPCVVAASQIPYREL